MTVLTPSSLRVLDQQACDEIRGLIETNQAREALERLAFYEAHDRRQRIQFHGLLARARAQLGELEDAIREWVKALHLTSRARDLRPRVRICLADTLGFAGDAARAERVVQRCVAEIRARGGDPLEPWALNTLAYLHLMRGSLSLAVRLYESALALLGDGSSDRIAWASLTNNYSLALMRWGEHSRAQEALSRVAGPAVEAALPNKAPLFLSRALLALESGDLDACADLLATIDDAVLGDDERCRRIRIQVAAALQLERGRPEAALELVKEGFRIVQAIQSPPVRNVELLRLRALALLGLGHPAEGLASAREALQACGAADMLDRPSVLRVVAKCLAALGRVEEAKDHLATELSLLESTEFVLERQRLYRDMGALGMALPGAGLSAPSPAPHPTGRNGTFHRFELADGRCFVTADRAATDRIRTAAESRLPVLLEGETGTGKELVARLLHEMGSARQGPFVVVDCTTLSETLAEAELFGVARGAYTGASVDRHGLVGAADGGTLLFDELPELSLSAQSKLLRLLQEGTYRRLGEAQPRRVRVRVIAATNQDSERLLATGALKPDLFFRLHGYRIRLRPLRERPDDVALLAEVFAKAEGLRGVTPEALAELERCAWPGNARQLEMLIRVAASGLPESSWLDHATVAALLEEAPQLPAPSAERQRLKRALDASAGNVAAAARALGMSRQGLYKALHRNGLL